MAARGSQRVIGMKTRKPLTRKTPLRQRRREGADLEREPRPMALQPSLRPLRSGTYGGATSGVAVRKTTPYRNPALLEMARGRHCLMRIPGVCVGATETTVAAHSNLLAHGKGKGRKADDCYSVCSCFACHWWLDNGMASAEDKEVAFMTAHARQVLRWRFIANDPAEPPRFRRAALQVLAHLNATPLKLQADGSYAP